MNERFSSALPEICRWLSKNGDFYCGRETLTEMAQQCSPDEVMEVYAYFRSESGRFESEWRPAFVEIFPDVASSLPEIDSAEFWGSRLHQLVSAGDLDGVRAFISEIGANSWRIADRNCAIYPFEDEDESGLTPLEQAKRAGFAEIAAFLEETLQRIRGKPGELCSPGAVNTTHVEQAQG